MRLTLDDIGIGITIIALLTFFACTDEAHAEEPVIEESTATELITTTSGEFVVYHAGFDTCDPAEAGARCAIGAQKLIFTDRFPMPVDNMSAECLDECRDPAVVSGINNYIISKNPDADGIELATWLTEDKALYPLVPLEAAVPTMLGESTFRPNAINYNGRGWRDDCIGLFQWMRGYHEAAMRRQGLDIFNPRDNVKYFFIHVNEDLAAGRSLDYAMKPWEVWIKYGARAEYRRLMEEGWPQ